MIGNNIFVSLYRPPSGNKQQFVNELTTWIENIGNKSLYIAGDFNLNYLNQEKTHFDSIEYNTQLKPCITNVTRIASSTCIDNILTNIRGTHIVSLTSIADHQGLISQLNLKEKKETHPREQFTYREMKEGNWNTFANELTQLSIRGTSIDQKWTNLSDDIKKIVEKAFPEKKSNIKYKFQMTQGLLKSKNKKNKLLKQYKRGIIPKETYTRYNKLYRKLVLKEQENTFRTKLTESGTDSKKKWRILKEELKIKTDKENITVINDNGLITDKVKIAESFKNHFESCATKLAQSVRDTGDCEILTEQQPEWGFHAITEEELIKMINTLVPKASCGFDLLSNRMLKKEKFKFAKLLINLINETLLSNTFPKTLKTAKVIPIFKKGEKSNLNNYRPISLLPVLSKVLEKIINVQITKKLDERNIIDENQYGFRSNHSTEDAVVKFIDYIEKAKLNHRIVVSIHIDVSKAFDSCNHDIMTKKLKNIGLSGTSLELMTSYLTDRIQELWMDNITGGKFIINIGVGQGTVLGPTLFKIYIMDMYLSTKLFSIRFADDSNLVGQGNNKEDTEKMINDELVKLHNWFCKNKLTLHPDKSRIIVHTRDKLINIKLGGKQLMRCGYGMQEEGVKFLGIIIDENLDWKLQINNVKKKIGKGNYLLWRYRAKLSSVMKKTIYESFVRTHLTYCLSVWGSNKTSCLQELKKLIKKIWTKIGKRKQHTNQRLIEHNILKLEDEIKILEIKLVWRWEKKKIPKGLTNIIQERFSRNLRNRQFIRETNWNHNSLAYRLATRAKNEIKEIEIAKSKKGLTKKYRNKCLLIDYNNPCRIRNCFICVPPT